MVLFEYFNAKDQSKLQILNRRMYSGILPNWINKVKIQTKIKFRVTNNVENDEDYN